MTRPRRLKLLYVFACLALMALIVVVAWRLPYDKKGLIFIVAGCVFFLVARLQGVAFRNLHRGRRLHDQGRYEAAIQHLDLFLTQVRAQPWRAWFVYLGGFLYTWDLEALTLNNLGSALLRLGRLDEAETRLRESLAQDPGYAMPYWNLAVLVAMRGDEPAARDCLARCESLGYRKSSLDQVIHLGQTLLSKVESWGTSRHA